MATTHGIGGKSLAAGATILTAAANESIAIVGLRASNLSASNIAKIDFAVGGFLISGAQLTVAPSGAYAFMENEKIFLNPGESLVATSDTDNAFDVYVSYAITIVV